MPRKCTGPNGVPRHQLALRGDPGASSSIPNLDPQAEIVRLTATLNEATEEAGQRRRFFNINKRLRDESQLREDAARERVQELEFYVWDIKEHNTVLSYEVHRLMDPEYQ